MPCDFFHRLVDVGVRQGGADAWHAGDRARETRREDLQLRRVPDQIVWIAGSRQGHVVGIAKVGHVVRIAGIDAGGISSDLAEGEIAAGKKDHSECCRRRGCASSGHGDSPFERPISPANPIRPG